MSGLLSTISNFVFRGRKTNGNANLDFFDLLSKSERPFLKILKNFVFRSERTNDRLCEMINFVFSCKKRIAVGVQL